MRKLFVTVAALFTLSVMPAQATYYHHTITRAVTPTPSGPSASGKFFCVANPGGFFVCAVLVGIIVHEALGPACASNSKYNRDHGYDQPTFWRPLCKRQRDPATRHAKLWPMGK